jgi:hypothetical protein
MQLVAAQKLSAAAPMIWATLIWSTRFRNLIGSTFPALPR